MAAQRGSGVGLRAWLRVGLVAASAAIGTCGSAEAAGPAAAGPASAGPPLTRIVAIGASNTSGWGVGETAAYPARLEALLREQGLDARVVNAGVPFETTNGMLARIDSSVPDGTRIVIIQPGGNDLRFLGTRARRTANIDAMVARLAARGITPIVYDPDFPSADYQWDFIHINAAGHGRIAQALLPQVLAALRPPSAARTGRPDRRPRRPGR